MDFTFLWLKLKLSFAWFIIFSCVSIYCNTKYKKYTSKFYNSKHLCKNSKHLFTRKEKKPLQKYYEIITQQLFCSTISKYYLTWANRIFIGTLKTTKKCLHVWQLKRYSQSCLMWPSKGTVKYGHIRQVVT